MPYEMIRDCYFGPDIVLMHNGRRWRPGRRAAGAQEERMRGSKRQRKKLAFGTERARRDARRAWLLIHRALCRWPYVVTVEPHSPEDEASRTVNITVAVPHFTCTLDGRVLTGSEPGDTISLECGVKDVTP